MDQDIKILETQSVETLASWWSMLNRFEWPDELPNPEPAEYVKNGRRSQLMSWINMKIGRKECLRDWNKDNMSNEEFEQWWNSEYA